MNEFDLRSFLYSNPLLESEAKLKAAKEKLEKQEAKLDKVDMKDEDAKEKADHHKKAIKNVSKEIKDLEKDLAFDKKAEAKEEKEAKAEAKAKKKKKDVNEATKPSSAKMFFNDFKDEIKMAKQKFGKDADKVLAMLGLKDGEMKEEMENNKLTKEGLKEMIRERITSILNEETVDEGDNYYEDVTEDVTEAEEVDVDVDEKEDIDVDIEKDVKIDDESEKSEIEVDGEIAGESSDKAAVLSLLTKAQELVPTLGGDQEQNDKMVQQVNNTITMFARDYLASTPE